MFKKASTLLITLAICFAAGATTLENLSLNQLDEIQKKNKEKIKKINNYIITVQGELEHIPPGTLQANNLEDGMASAIQEKEALEKENKEINRKIDNEIYQKHKH